MEVLVIMNDDFLNELEILESIINLFKKSCELCEINSIYYDLAANDIYKLSKERNDYINLLNVLQEKVCLLKESLRLIGSSSLGAGELANFLVTCSFLLLPSIVYRYRKNFKTVISAVYLFYSANIQLAENRHGKFHLDISDTASSAITVKHG